MLIISCGITAPLPNFWISSGKWEKWLENVPCLLGLVKLPSDRHPTAYWLPFASLQQSSGEPSWRGRFRSPAHERRCEEEGAAGGRPPDEKDTSSRRSKSGDAKGPQLTEGQSWGGYGGVPFSLNVTFQQKCSHPLVIEYYLCLSLIVGTLHM